MNPSPVRPHSVGAINAYLRAVPEVDFRSADSAEWPYLRGAFDVEDCVEISNEDDVIAARQRGRELAGGIGFSLADQSMLAAVITELARNILEYAVGGEITFHPVEADGRPGLEVVARDSGPGIPDIREAMETSYSVAGGLGVGLRGAKALMDVFEITSTPGRGTTVKAKKWRT